MRNFLQVILIGLLVWVLPVSVEPRGALGAPSGAADVLRRLNGMSPAAHIAALEKGAQTEGGQVVWLVGRNLEEVTRIVEAFKARYPFMNVEFIRAGEGAAQRILTESRAGISSADVLDLSAVDSFLLKDAGALAAYKSPEAARIPDEFKDPDGYWTSVDVLPMVIAYNTRGVRQQELPRSFEALTDARWRGRLGRTSVTGAAWVAGMLKVYGERRGLEIIRGIAQNQVRLFTSNTGMGNQIVQGEVHLGFDVNVTVPIREKGRGAPIDFYTLDGFVFTDPSPLAINGGTKRPLAAALLVNWLLSMEGQQRAAQVTGGARMSTRTDVPYQHAALLRGKRAILYGPDLIGAQLNRFQDLFNQAFVR
jgi:iron(III) transport system substrate-binding protein